MIYVARTDTSVVGRWWWTVDRWLLASLIVLIFIGVLLTMAASPAVAERLGADGFFFIRRQLIYLLPALGLMFGTSLLTPLQVRRVAVVVFAASVCLLLLTMLVGTEIKGARRWIDLGFFSLQPSEFLKPSFIVVTAWLFSEQRRQENFNGDRIAIALAVIVAALLLLQPDLGMTTLVLAVWFGQYFLAGLSFTWVALFGGAGVLGLFTAYMTFPHVKSRVDRFLDPTSGDSYQVERSLEAFMSGGIFGRGPGEGIIKSTIPDVHSDFIFAVAGEEFGLLVCLLIVGVFAFIILRSYSRLLTENNLFVLLATAGLVAQFGLQALVNMGSTVQLIPAKGMTLPFISYGGSSLLALSFGMGMVLALTRKRPSASI